jgi:AcrR family transcriptional regulator
LLRDAPSEQLFDLLDARPVTSRAGLSTGAFYHHFAGPDEFAEALLEHALAKDPNPPFREAVRAFEAAIADGEEFVPAMLAAAARMLAWQDQNATFALQLLVWAKNHRDARMQARLARMYQLVEDQQNAYYEGILQAIGRQTRPPYTLADVSRVFTALFEGLTMRRAVTPALVPPERMGELLVPLILFMTREPGDTRDVPAWLADEGPGWVQPQAQPTAAAAHCGT